MAHSLFPPPWIALLYSLFAAPFMILAAAVPIAFQIWGRSRDVRAWVDAFLLEAVDTPLKATVLLVAVGSVLACGCAAFATILLSGRYARHAQTRRNQQATLIGARFDSPFVLYLRPFVEDRRSFTPNTFGDTCRFMYGTRIPIEVALSLALHPDHRVLAIGDKFRSLGADKISVDDDRWFDVVKQLAREASALVMIPGYRNATAREIDFLFSSPDLLSKTIFVQPPCNDDDRHWRDWLDYTTAARGQDVPMPDPDRAGQVFFRSPRGDIRSIPLGKFDTTTIRLLVDRASRAALVTYGLDRATIEREEKETSRPSPASDLVGFVNTRLGPRWLIGLSMAVLAPAYLAAAAQLTTLHRLGAGNAAAQSYFQCANRMANLSPARRELCRREAAAEGLPLIAEQARALIARGELTQAEALYRRAMQSLLAPDAHATSPGVTRTDHLRVALNWNVLTLYSLERGGLTVPADVDLLGNVPGVDELLARRRQMSEPILREFAADNDAYLILLDGPTAATTRDLAEALAEMYELLGSAYETRGRVDLALVNYRKRLMVLLIAAEMATPPERLWSAFPAAIADLNRYPNENAVPWELVDVGLYVTPMGPGATPAEAAQRDRIRALVSSLPTVDEP